MAVLHEDEFAYTVAKLVALLNTKANKSNYYNKTEIYTKAEIDSKYNEIYNNLYNTMYAKYSNIQTMVSQILINTQ